MLRPRIHVYILLAAVIIAAIAGYYLPDRRPRNASMHSPKEYIQIVEQGFAERRGQPTPEARQPSGGNE